MSTIMVFDHFRSICSSTLSGWYAGLSVVIPTNPDDSSAEEQKRVNSAVQARIEAMFASVEAESGTPGECAAAILPVMTRIIMHAEHTERKRERCIARYFCSSHPPPLGGDLSFGGFRNCNYSITGECAHLHFHLC